MKKNEKRWIVWLYAAVLSIFVIAGLVYCVKLGSSSDFNSNPSTYQSASVGDSDDVVDLGETTVPLSDASAE